MNILDDILGAKREHVRACAQQVPLERLQDTAAYYTATRGFARRLRESPHSVALIAEIKKASPSRGILRQDVEAAGLARSYEAGGADCLSVLTDTDYFQGSAADLESARAASTLPCLRKDFIVDEYQIHESKAMGADCVLLIAAAIPDRDLLASFQGIARGIGLDVLVEVHSETEMEAACAIGSALVGINNRDLATFETDLATTERLAGLAPPQAIVVSESGIKTSADVARIRAAGARAMLVGEGLVLSGTIEQALAELLGA